MFKFEKIGWKANRGTGGTIIFKPREGQELKEDDIIKLNVYDRNSFDQDPILTKVASINTEENEATLILTNEDMELNPISNKKETYWYEVKYNGATIIGYDERGVKILELYPEGSED